MAVFAGPEIVNDRLVFHFDLENGVKSWKGKPTSNLVTNTPIMNGWAGSYTVIDSDTKTFNIQTTQNNSTTTSAWRTWYWDVSAYVGQTVTISGDVEFVSETNATFLHITIGQGNTGSFPYHIAGSSPEDRVQISTKPIEKIKMYWTGVINSTGVVGFTQWINNVTAAGGNAVLQISNVQIEINNFPTKFVNGVRLDTASIVDLSPNQNTITAANLTYRQDDTPTFDGVDDYLDTGFGNYSEDEITLDVWFNTPITSGTRTLIGRSTINSSEEIDLIFGYSNPYRLVARFTGPSNQVLYEWPVENANQWKNVVMSVKNNGSTRTNTLYVDGVSVGSTTSSSSIQPYAGNFYIGKLDTRYFLGEISQVKIYNKALTAAEVKQNFEAVRPRYGI
jgi:hypothetical protein